MIEQSDDYRLDPALHHSCQADINLYCSQILAKQRPESEYNGQVLHCLKVRIYNFFSFVILILIMMIKFVGKVSTKKAKARM